MGSVRQSSLEANLIHILFFILSKLNVFEQSKDTFVFLLLFIYTMNNLTSNDNVHLTDSSGNMQ